MDQQHSKQYFPIMVDATSLHWVIIGGGSVATRKVRTLLEQGVKHLSVVAPEISAELVQFAQQQKIKAYADEYKISYLEGKQIVYAATDDIVLNRTICRDAKLLNLMVCNVSEQNAGNFITPSFFQREDLIFAISSQGKSPILTKLLLDEWVEHIDQHIVELLPVLEQLRQDLKRDIEKPTLRQQIMREATERLLSEEVHDYQEWYKSLLKYNC